MLCWRYRRLLMGYAECELDERLRARVEAHVARCRRCAEELAVIRSVSGAIKAAETPAMEPAPDLWARVSARIEREALRPVRRPWIRVTQATSACAAAVLVAVVGFGLMRSDLPREDSRTQLPPRRPAEIAGRPAVEKLHKTPAAKPARPARPKRWFADAGTGKLMVEAGKRSLTEPGGEGTARERRAPLPPPRSSVVASGTGLSWHYHGDELAVKLDSAGSLAASAPSAAAASALADHPASPERARSAGPATAPAETPSVGSRLGTALAMKPPSAAPAAGAGDRGDTSFYLHASPDGANALGFGEHEEAASKGVAVDAKDKLSGRMYDDYGGREHAGLSVGKDRESVVDALNKTEGVRFAALFSYP